MIVATDWGEVAVAIALIAMIAVLGSGYVLQILASGRASRRMSRDVGYRQLAEEAAELQRSTLAALDDLRTELGELTQKAGELERLLKDVG
jgi:Tfp pilus assembly protein PilO